VVSKQLPGGQHPSIDGLAALGPQVIPTLTEAVGDKDYDVRICAAWALSRFDDARVVAPLLRFAATQKHYGQLTALVYRRNAAMVGAVISALQHSDPRIAEVAATCLGSAREERAVPALAALLTGGPGQAKAAIWALSEIGGKAAADALAGALSGPHRQQAAVALGMLRDPRAVDGLIEIVNNEGRTTAILVILGEIGDPRAVPVLQAALRDADQGTRFRAANALGRIRIAQLSTSSSTAASQ